MRMAAARPPTQASVGLTVDPALAACVDRGGGGAGDDPGNVAEQGQHDRLGQELDPDVGAGSAQGPAQPDLRPPFEYGNDHDGV